MQELRGHGEISLSTAYMDMAEKRRQVRKESLDVSAFLVPSDEPVNGKRVAQVVQPRPEAAPVGTLNMRHLAETFEAN